MSNSKLVLAILLFYLSRISKSQVHPSQYTVCGSISLNGSSATGNCHNVSNDTNNIATCHDPTSSVLFDGNTTLTGTAGTMWASQLLTVHSSPSLTFSFAGTPGFVGVRRVEIVLFNCPEWEISVQDITLQTSSGFAGVTTPNIASCDSLVRSCIGNLNTNMFLTELTLTFTFSIPNDRVHIAEIEFYGAGPNCPHIPTQPPTPSTVTIMSKSSPDTTITTPTSPQVAIITTPTVMVSTSSPDTSITTPTPPPDATITMTTPPPDTTIIMLTPSLDTIITTSTPNLSDAISTLPPDTIVTISPSPLVGTTTTGELDKVSSNNNDNSTQANDTSNSLYTILPIVFTFLFILACSCVAAVVFLCWRCYHHPKHSHIISNTENTVLNKPRTNENEVFHVPLECLKVEQSTNGPLSSADDNQVATILQDLSEQDTAVHSIDNQKSETDTVDPLYSTADNMSSVLPKTETSSNPTYSTVDVTEYTKLDTSKLTTSVNMYSKIQVDEKGYSIEDEASTFEASTATDQLYSQVDKKKKNVPTVSYPLEMDTAVDQLCSQVDEKKKEASMNSYLSETAVDQLYAQVDKKNKKEISYPSEATTTVDQLYTQVDKKKCKNKDEILTAFQSSTPLIVSVDEQRIEDFCADQETVYSIVNKPWAPQIPPKSDLLMEDEPTAPQLPPKSDLLMEDEPTPPQLHPKSDALVDEVEEQVSYNITL